MAIRIFTVAAFLAMLAFAVAIPSAYAHNSPSVAPPSQCSRFVPGGPNTNHSAFTSDFLGTPKSVFSTGESVNLKVNVNSSVGDTDVNRAKVVWIDPLGVVVAVSLLPRGTQSSTSWNVTAGLTTGSSGSANPIGTWTTIVCHETPNNSKGKGVTHHIDMGTCVSVSHQAIGMHHHLVQRIEAAISIIAHIYV